MSESIQPDVRVQQASPAAAESKPRRAARRKSPRTDRKAEPKERSSSTLAAPQLRILAALASSKAGLTRIEIAAKAKVAASWVSGFVSKACKANSTKSLVEQRMAKRVEIDVHADGGRPEVRFEITALGRKALGRSA